MTRPADRRLATEKYVNEVSLTTDRRINTTAPIQGGGDLSNDRTLSVLSATPNARGVVRLAGDLGGTADAPEVPGLDDRPLRQYGKRNVTAAYTVTANDTQNVVLHITASTAVTITLPTDANAVIAEEIAIPWRQYGGGQITFVAQTGAVIRSRGAVFRSAGQFAEGMITKVAANTWLLSGDIVA